MCSARKRVKRSKKEWGLSDLPRDLIQEILDWRLQLVRPGMSLFGYRIWDVTRSIWPVFRSVALIPPNDDPPPVPIPWKNLRVLNCSTVVAGKANLSRCKHMVSMGLFGDMFGFAGNRDFYPPNLIRFQSNDTRPVNKDSPVLPRVPLPLRILHIDAKTFRLHNGSEYYADVQYVTLMKDEDESFETIPRVKKALMACDVDMKSWNISVIELDGTHIVGLTLDFATAPLPIKLLHCRRLKILHSEWDTVICGMLPILNLRTFSGKLSELSLFDINKESLRSIQIRNPKYGSLLTLRECSNLETLHIVGGWSILSGLSLMPVQTTLVDLRISGISSTPLELYLPKLERLDLESNEQTTCVRNWYMPELLYLRVDNCSVILPTTLPKLERVYLRYVPKLSGKGSVVNMPMLNQLKIKKSRAYISNWVMPRLKEIILDRVQCLRWTAMGLKSLTTIWLHSYFPSVAFARLPLRFPALRTIFYSGEFKFTWLRCIDRGYPDIETKRVTGCPKVCWRRQSTPW